jgi:hypothetical protein
VKAVVDLTGVIKLSNEWCESHDSDQGDLVEDLFVSTIQGEPDPDIHLIRVRWKYSSKKDIQDALGRI